MSRYINVDTITFTNFDGNSYPVKDTREISVQTINQEIDVDKGDLLDEIASRNEVFGANGEIQTWRLFDANIVTLTESNFQIENIKKLKVPL
jgi:hypothetical protein